MLSNLLPSICFPFWNAGCKLQHSRVRWYVQRQQQNDNNIRGFGKGRNALPIRPNHNNTLTSQFQTDAIKNELTKTYAKSHHNGQVTQMLKQMHMELQNTLNS